MEEAMSQLYLVQDDHLHTAITALFSKFDFPNRLFIKLVAEIPDAGTLSLLIAYAGDEAAQVRRKNDLADDRNLFGTLCGFRHAIGMQMAGGAIKSAGAIITEPYYYFTVEPSTPGVKLPTLWVYIKGNCEEIQICSTKADFTALITEQAQGVAEWMEVLDSILE
jgi:hypothetical protein